MTDPPHTPVQAAAGIAASTVEGLRGTPTLLVMVVLNCMMIAAAAWYLLKLEDNRKSERERFAGMFERCMKDGKP